MHSSDSKVRGLGLLRRQATALAGLDHFLSCSESSCTAITRFPAVTVTCQRPSLHGGKWPCLDANTESTVLVSSTAESAEKAPAVWVVTAARCKGMTHRPYTSSARASSHWWAAPGPQASLRRPPLQGSALGWPVKKQSDIRG